MTKLDIFTDLRTSNCIRVSTVHFTRKENGLHHNTLTNNSLVIKISQTIRRNVTILATSALWGHVRRLKTKLQVFLNYVLGSVKSETLWSIKICPYTMLQSCRCSDISKKKFVDTHTGSQIPTTAHEMLDLSQLPNLQS